jgi:hypothetical protein
LIVLGARDSEWPEFLWATDAARAQRLGAPALCSMPNTARACRRATTARANSMPTGAIRGAPAGRNRRLVVVRECEQGEQGWLPATRSISDANANQRR